MISVASGLVAIGALAVPTASASDAPVAHTFSATQLTQAGTSVLKSDVPGTAWAVDQKTKQVVVTADSTVSQAEIARIQKAAGSNAGALKIERTPARSRSWSPAATPSMRVAGAARSASTSARAAPTTS